MDEEDQAAYPLPEKKIGQCDRTVKEESSIDSKTFEVDAGGMIFHHDSHRGTCATVFSALVNCMVLCCSPCVFCYRKSVRRRYSFDDAEPKSIPSKEPEIEAQIEAEHAPEVMRARPSFMSFRPRISLAFNHSDDEDEDDMKMQMSDSQSKSPSGQLVRPPARKGSAIYHSRLLKLFEGMEPETDDEESSSLMIALPYHPHFPRSPHPHPEDL